MTHLPCVCVEFDPKPGPLRYCDWGAWIDGQEEITTVYAPSHDEAVDEVLERYEEWLERWARLATRLP
jgi:hypothetical protein